LETYYSALRYYILVYYNDSLGSIRMNIIDINRLGNTYRTSPYIARETMVIVVYLLDRKKGV
jgi:hypothetical protein